MYTVTQIIQVSERMPSSWVLKTQEEFDIKVQYRFGIIMFTVNDEVLHKSRISPLVTSSQMSTQEMLEYIKHELPEELFELTTIKKQEDD